MSTELIIAICALVTALAGVAVGIFRFGQLAQRVQQLEASALPSGLTQRVQQLEKDADRLEGDIKTVRKEGSEMLEKIESKLDAIWQFLHEHAIRKPGEG